MSPTYNKHIFHPNTNHNLRPRQPKTLTKASSFAHNFFSSTSAFSSLQKLEPIHKHFMALRSHWKRRTLIRIATDTLFTTHLARRGFDVTSTSCHKCLAPDTLEHFWKSHAVDSSSAISLSRSQIRSINKYCNIESKCLENKLQRVSICIDLDDVLTLNKIYNLVYTVSTGGINENQLQY